MAEKTLLARVQEDEANPGTLLVRSPVVGLADGRPAKEIFLNALDRVLTIKVLGERHVLRLPRDRYGRVVDALIPNALTPVEFDQPLLRIDPRALEAAEGAAASVAGSGAAGDDAASNLVTVTSPSDGIFYRRPSPDAPPYVDEGTEVGAGTVLGLVEVMKCFNQITYGGAEYPPKGKITKVMVGDAEEVSYGHPLFKVMPLGE